MYPSAIFVNEPPEILQISPDSFFMNCVRLNPAATTNMAAIKTAFAFPKLPNAVLGSRHPVITIASILAKETIVREYRLPAVAKPASVMTKITIQIMAFVLIVIPFLFLRYESKRHNILKLTTSDVLYYNSSV